MTDKPVLERTEPQPYLTGLEAYLAHLRDTDYYPGLLHSYTDIQRFESWLLRLDPYISLAGCSVLDMGAGTGGLLLACQQRGATRLMGLEVESELYELAQLRLAGTGIEYLLTDGNAVPLPEATFDVIFSVHVIEHVVSPSVYLAEMARLLRPNGVALLSCPNRLWPYEPHAQLPFLPYLPMTLAKALCNWRSRSKRVPERIRRQYHTGTLLSHYFSFMGLRRLCRQAGLEFIEVNPPGLFVVVPKVSFGAWGQAHPRFENAFNELNRWLVRDRIAPYVRSHPYNHFAHWLALTLNFEIGGILRKVS